MKATEFCYWLQGYFEIKEADDTNGSSVLYDDQVEIIRKHLNMVFIHDIDPSYPKAQQDALNKAHNTNPQTTLRC